jgi:hypothetical protein
MSTSCGWIPANCARGCVTIAALLSMSERNQIAIAAILPLHGTFHPFTIWKFDDAESSEELGSPDGSSLPAGGEKRMKKSPEDVAAYIGPQCMQLRTMATDAKLETLAYLLEMASLEASRLHLDMLQTKTKQMRGDKTARTTKRKRRSTAKSAA